MASGGGGPAQDAGLELFEVPAFGLFIAVMVAAERSVAAFTEMAVDLGKKWVPTDSAEDFLHASNCGGAAG
jgi:hypothetical protein